MTVQKTQAIITSDVRALLAVLVRIVVRVAPKRVATRQRKLA